LRFKDSISINPLLTLLAIVQIIGCRKNGDNHDDQCFTPQFQVNYNRWILEGDPLWFNLVTQEDLTYSWSGPDGFTSTEKSPVIDNPAPINSGEYIVTAKSGACEHTEKFVVQVSPTSPCKMLANRINLVTQMVFTTVTVDTNAAGHFEMRGTGSDGNVRIEFYDNPIKRVNYVYRFSATDTSATHASMQILIASTNETWEAISGKLYFGLIDNREAITICDADMNNLQTGASYLGVTGALNTP